MTLGIILLGTVSFICIVVRFAFRKTVKEPSSIMIK